MLPVHEEGGNHLLYYMVSEDPVTMHMDKTIRDPDRNQFIKALGKEFADQYNNKSFSIIHHYKVPEKATILPTVWKMKRNQDIKT